MPNIPTVQGHPVFTQALQAKWDEFLTLKPTGFLRSFFKTRKTSAKLISVAVRRGTEKIAVDVLRGTEGNRNELRKHSLKEFLPPYFKEYFDATDIDHYDVVFERLPEVGKSTGLIAEAARSALNQVEILKAKIDRAYELQAAQVLQTGIVTLENGDNIDYKRKAGSIEAKTAPGYWTVDTVDPLVDLANGAKWIKENGRTAASEFIVIMGADVLSAYLANPHVQNQANLRRIDRTKIGMPTDMGEGAIFHGQDAGGDYRFNIWTYPQYYDAAGGTRTPYVDANKMIMIPVSGTEFIFSFAGVPYLVPTNNPQMPMIIQRFEGDYLLYSTVDDRADKHEFGVKSAGLAVPVSVDQIYTLRPVL